ncbi:MAG TPA: TM0106 family RecB-like putative nuclease [Acidimicrobiales bacterium]|nr:TM0106 family RecB-like putative nuclease [Acidimicrobiales bacterium]
MTPGKATLDPGAAARCAFRTVLEHDEVGAAAADTEHDDTTVRRFDAAAAHRRDVAATMLALHGARAFAAGRDVARTLEALGRDDLDVVVDPALPPDDAGRRRGAPGILVADRNGGAIAWRPVDVHNHFLTAEGTSSLRTSSLAAPSVERATLREGVRLRRGGAWHRDALRLAHHHRRLETMGATGSSRPVGGVVDRATTLWWLALDEPLDDRGTPLAQYDARFAERVQLLEATEARRAEPGLARPGAPWWHRECDECPFSATCHAELSADDDVSLVRFSSAADQELLRDHGVRTRRALAGLELELVSRGVAMRDEPSEAGEPVAVSIGRRLRDAERLVRRARVEVAGSLLRLVPAASIDARRAEVEIDFDMESYDNATYLWGTLVTVRAPTPGLTEGYRAFAEWGELTERAEGALFARFYAWLEATVRHARGQGRTVGLYCFWEHAERAQVRRAMGSGVERLPTEDALRDVLLDPLVDLHQVVTSQLQTAGPAGLKVVAGAAGFSWRDAAPSGEASMAWYEEARAADPSRAAAAVHRLLAYNEDDCLATRALRDWLEGGATQLPSVEEARPVDS